MLPHYSAAAQTCLIIEPTGATAALTGPISAQTVAAAQTYAVTLAGLEATTNTAKYVRGPTETSTKYIGDTTPDRRGLGYRFELD